LNVSSKQCSCFPKVFMLSASRHRGFSESEAGTLFPAVDQC
jgi:hypothetical protein